MSAPAEETTALIKYIANLPASTNPYLAVFEYLKISLAVSHAFLCLSTLRGALLNLPADINFAADVRACLAENFDAGLHGRKCMVRRFRLALTDVEWIRSQVRH